MIITRSFTQWAIAVAMVVGGLWLLGAQLFVSDIIYFKLVIGGVVLATLGVYLLWADFIAPLLGFKGEG